MNEDNLNLHAALAQAQSEFPTIEKNRVAKVPTKSGKEYTYRYADLSDIMNAVRPILSKRGISLSQYVENGMLVTQLFKHPHTLKGGVPLVEARGEGPQAMGSALTYARRYSLCAVLGIVAEEDDDAQSAQHDRQKDDQRSAQGKGSASKPGSKQDQGKTTAPPKRKLTPAEKKAADKKANLLGFDNHHKHDAMVKLLWVTARKAGWTKEDIAQLLASKKLPESTRELHWADLNNLKKFVEFNNPPREPGAEG